jgi:phosphoglycolate phosphatase
VGDTPSDIAATHANKLPVIAVATGHFSFDRLLEDSPEICADNLGALLIESECVASSDGVQGEPA